MPTSLPSPPDPFQTPIQSTSLLPNLIDETRRVAAPTLPLQVNDQSGQPSKPAQLGEPISLGVEAGRVADLGSDDSTSNDDGDNAQGEPTTRLKLDGARPSSEKDENLFYTTPARRPSPPLQRVIARDDRDSTADGTTGGIVGIAPSKSSATTTATTTSSDDDRDRSRFSHPASTPYDRDGEGVSLLTSEIGGSPAYTDIRTPGVGSSVRPIGRRMDRIIRRHRGRHDDDDDEEEDEEEEDANGKDITEDGRKGVRLNAQQPSGLSMISRSTTSSALAHALLSTPAPRSAKVSSTSSGSAMGFKDVSTVFPFALSTPQNIGRRSVDGEEIDEEVPVQFQPAHLDAKRRAGKDDKEEDEGVVREDVEDELPPPTPFGRSFDHSASSSMLTTPHPRDRISRSTFDIDGDEAQDEANTPGSSSLTSTGKKRRRTSPEELKVLEEAYERNQLPTSEERVRLADRTGMSTRAVQIWFQNKRQTEKRKASQRVYPTMMLVPLRQGGPSNQSQSQASTSASASGQPGSFKHEQHPQSDHDHDHRVHSSSPFSAPLGLRKSAERNGTPPGMPGYQYVPVTASGSAAMLGGSLLDNPSQQSMMIIGKGKRAVLPEDGFFSRPNAGGVAAKVLDKDEDGLDVETEVDEEADHVDDVDSGEEDDRGRSKEAILPTSDVRSSSPALHRSSSPGVLLKERQQLKRRGSSADDKKKEDAKKKDRLMLFPSSSSVAVSDEVPATSASQTNVLETPRAKDRSSRSVSTPKTQESSKPASLRRTTSERMPGSVKRQIIGIADISANNDIAGSQPVDASPSAPFGGRRFVVTQSVPSFSVRKDGLFAKPDSPLGKRKYSRYSSGGFPIRAEPTLFASKSFGRSQSGILDEMCSRKELPFMPASMRKENAETVTNVESSETEDHVKVESEIMLSQNKAAISENSLLDLLPSDPPSMGLIDMNSDAENAPYEGDTDVEETPKKKMKTFDGSHGPGMRHFASLDYFAGSPSKRKGLLGDESRRLSGLGTARRRLFEAHLQQQAQQRATLKGKKQQSGKKKKPTTSTLKRSSSSSSASIALATIAATPKRKGLSNTHSMPDLALVSSDKANITPGRKIPVIAKDGKAEQQTDEEAARLLLGLFGGR